MEDIMRVKCNQCPEFNNLLLYTSIEWDFCTHENKHQVNKFLNTTRQPAPG